MAPTLFPLPFPPSPAALLAAAALRAVNGLLAREAWARARLQRHAGKTVWLHVAAVKLACTVSADGGLAQAAEVAKADVTLTLRLERLNAALAGGVGGIADRGGADKAGRVGDTLTELLHIEGEAALAQDLGELARHLRPDPEDWLAAGLGRVLGTELGDRAALRLMRVASAASQGLRTGAARLAGNVAEYASEESGWLLARPAFEDARAALAALASQVAALQARAAQLPAPLLPALLPAPLAAQTRASQAVAACAPAQSPPP